MNISLKNIKHKFYLFITILFIFSLGISLLSFKSDLNFTGFHHPSSLNNYNYKKINIESLKHIDDYAKNVPEIYTKDIFTLTNYLIKPAKNNIEKVRAIWIWITDNIAYDVEGYFSGEMSTFDAQTAFEKKVGVCSGYSSLFKEMSDIANIESVAIFGYAKGYSYMDDVNYIPGVNHAWNAVKLENQWYLLDSTWASGYIDKNRNFVKRYEEFYFCPDPKDFIYTHFPQEYKWQLLNNTVEIDYFLNLSKVWPIFFKLGLNMESHKYKLIKTNKNGLEVIISAPSSNIKLTSKIQYRSGNIELPRPVHKITKDKDRIYWIFTVTLPSENDYLLTIFAGLDTSKTYTSAVRYYIIFE